MLRTHTCGELNKKNIGEEVTLCGWVHSRRDHGEVIFIDVRDAYGITQLVFDPEENRQIHEKAHELKSEYVVRAKGLVQERPKGRENNKLSTGAVEIAVKTVEILNSSLTPPFELDKEQAISDETRLKYRYVDLRRPHMQRNLRLRYKIINSIRRFLEKENFTEIETPFLTRSTPEGARDYLVPSRLNIGKFYALPQSPQLFKQILMVSGFDKYFQIVRCFRDEDLRKDRQPEFTQLDIEMSFVEENDIFTLGEGIMKSVFRDVLKVDIKTPFNRLPYDEAMARFGTDKPDMRFDLELVNLGDMLKDTKFNVFRKNLEKGGEIHALNAKGHAQMSRSKLDELIERAKAYGAGGLAYLKCDGKTLSSNIDKFFNKNELESIKERTKAEKGDLILIVSDKRETALSVLGALRLDLAKESGLIDKKKREFTWITDFPLFKYNEEDKRWVSEHHPFTACSEQDVKLLDSKDLGRIRARSYDLVINGSEIASGSIRIHKKQMQEKIFETIGLEKEEAARRFGFLMEAFKYGAPPHGGIAFGLDRFVTIFTGSDSIRDVIAFPKTQKSVCLLTGAPTEPDDKQLRELHIRRAK